jgi:tRNA threonylcarbamoyl adenosine modification protein YjeE
MRSGSWISKSEDETLKLARRFAAELREGDNVLLIGELGAGKTTFTRGVVENFNPDIPVSSPSYTIIQIYPTQPQICHVDLYRIDDASDLTDLGLEEHFDSDQIVLVEWAEKCGDYGPNSFFRVTLGIRSEDERDILVEDLTDAALS